MKHLLKKIGLSLFAILLSLFLGEIIFRSILFSETEIFKSLRDPTLYVDRIQIENETIFGEDYWKLNYYFNKTFEQPSAHPLLGWIGLFNGTSYIHHDEGQINNRRPVLLFGDSFARCIDSTTCFQEILNKDSSFNRNHFLLNYGVGGYGVDQIYLLMKEVVPRFEKPIVIFSLLTADMDRSMLQVRDAQKPYFSLKNDELVLHQDQLNIGSAAYFDQNPPNIQSYLWSKFTHSNLFTPSINKTEKEEYMQNSKKLNGAILEQAFDFLRNKKIDFMVLIFEPNKSKFDNWRMSFLREILHKKKVPYLCDMDIRQIADPHHFANMPKYVIRHDGHPTSAANRQVSTFLKKAILYPNYLNQLVRENEKWLDPQFLAIKNYERQILNDANWLNQVQQQALEKEVSLNEMIYRNARYMLEQERGIQIQDISFYQKQIRTNPDWLESTEKQANERSISLDSMIYLNASYMVRIDRKKRIGTTSE